MYPKTVSNISQIMSTSKVLKQILCFQQGRRGKQADLLQKVNSGNDQFAILVKYHWINNTAKYICHTVGITTRDADLFVQIIPNVSIWIFYISSLRVSAGNVEFSALGCCSSDQAVEMLCISLSSLEKPAHVLNQGPVGCEIQHVNHHPSLVHA